RWDPRRDRRRRRRGILAPRRGRGRGRRGQPGPGRDRRFRRTQRAVASAALFVWTVRRIGGIDRRGRRIMRRRALGLAVLLVGLVSGDAAADCLDPTFGVNGQTLEPRGA